MKFNPFGKSQEPRVTGRENVVHLKPNLEAKSSTEAVTTPDMYDVVNNLALAREASSLAEKILSRHTPQPSLEGEQGPLINLVQQLLTLSEKINGGEGITPSDVALASEVKERLDKVFKQMMEAEQVGAK